MRFLRFSPIVLGVLGLGGLAMAAPVAAADPAIPPPLEKKVWDADIVAVVQRMSRPAHARGVFIARVLAVSKGDVSPGVDLRVRAAPSAPEVVRPGASEVPPAIEAEADRLILFLGTPEDGVRPSRHPVLLGPERTATAWYRFAHDAAGAPEAASVLARLHTETRPAEWTAIWVQGLRSANALLRNALLHRVNFGTRTSSYALVLGEDLAALVARQLAAARPEILSVVVDLAATKEGAGQALAFDVLAGDRATRGDDLGEEAQARFDRAATAAVAAARGGDPRTREAALALLARLGDPRMPTRLVAALLAPGAEDAHVRALAATGRRARLWHPALGEQIVDGLVDALDDERAARRAVRALATVLDEPSRGTVADWRAWARARVSRENR